jgi:dihydrofolate reductase
MKLTISFVASLNGKITKGLDDVVEKWASAEDQKHLEDLRQGTDVLIRSEVTYGLAKEKIKRAKDKLHVIITRNPEKFVEEGRAGFLEFVSGDLKEIKDGLAERGYKNALLSAGSGLAAAFMKEKLVDELVITFEPKVFGKGRPMFSDFEGDLDLKLLKLEKINESGTAVGFYEILG